MPPSPATSGRRPGPRRPSGRGRNRCREGSGGGWGGGWGGGRGGHDAPRNGGGGSSFSCSGCGATAKRPPFPALALSTGRCGGRLGGSPLFKRRGGLWLTAI